MKANKVIMVQVDITRGEPPTQAGMTTWVEKKPGLVRNSRITLKEFGDDVWWKVQKVYDLEMARDDLDKNRNWDNNDYRKHEGLGL